MDSDSENEFVDATDHFESGTVLSGDNSGLVLTKAYQNTDRLRMCTHVKIVVTRTILYIMK